MSTLDIALVTGGRDFADDVAADRALDHVRLAAVWQGECPTGADFLARQWARDRGVPLRGFPADWVGFGKAAGPIRNRQMADLLFDEQRVGKTVAVLVFPGGRGTKSMATQAKARGLLIVHVDDTPALFAPGGALAEAGRRWAGSAN
jgi:hypothetical protein